MGKIDKIVYEDDNTPLHEYFFGRESDTVDIAKESAIMDTVFSLNDLPHGLVTGTRTLNPKVLWAFGFIF